MNPAVFTPRAFSTYGVIHAPSNSPEVLMSMLMFSGISFAPFEVLIVPISLSLRYLSTEAYLLHLQKNGELRRKVCLLPQYPRLPKTGPLTLAKDSWNRYWGLAGTR